MYYRFSRFSNLSALTPLRGRNPMTKKQKNRVREIYTEMLVNGQITVTPASQNRRLLAQIHSEGIRDYSTNQLASVIGQALKLNNAPDYRQDIANVLNNLGIFEYKKPWTRETVYQWLYRRKTLHALPLRDVRTLINLIIQTLYVEGADFPLPPEFDFIYDTAHDLRCLIQMLRITIHELRDENKELNKAMNRLSDVFYTLPKRQSWIG